MKRLRYYIPVVLTAIFLFSCEQSLEELNRDPNNPSNIDPKVALPAGTTSLAAIVGGQLSIVGGIWSQHYTQNNASSQYKDLDAFYFTPANFNNMWQELYAGGLNDLEFVKDDAAAKKDWNVYLMATTLQTYGFHVATDIFGDIPFSEALRGNEGISEPAYESSAAIYDSLIARLDKALAKDFTLESNTDPGKSDFLFDGDMEKWVQFANTLKLKIYLRYALKNPAKASAGIQALYAAGANFLTEDAAMDEFEDLASKSNPFFEQDKRQLNTTQNLKASRTLFDYLKQNGDPRLYDIYLEAEGTAGGYKGMNQGDFNATSTALPPLTISAAKVEATDPVYFISAAESYFLQAEAVQRGWGTGNAQDLYEQGVTHSILNITLPDPLDIKNSADATAVASINLEADAEELLTTGPYNFANATDKLELILTQKWVALAVTHQGIESFFDRMRSGYPKQSPVYHSSAAYVPGYVVYPKEGTTQGKFATRLFLPDIETTRNPNAPDQANVWDPLWWQSIVQ